MLYFLDTEFIDDGLTIDLISIGIVSEDGRELYYISNQFEPRNASQWVVDNVLSKLPNAPTGLKAPNSMFNNTWSAKTINLSDPSISYQQKCDALLWQDKKCIANGIKAFVGDDTKPEFWGAWSAYDWVVFCQLFGTMMELPKGYPYYCKDVIQWADQLGLDRQFLPVSPIDEHNALADARWVKDSHNLLSNYVSKVI